MFMLSDNFYHATLCGSAIFAVARCPSICLSVTLVDCIQTAEDIVKLLVQPGSPIILVFWPPAPIPNSKGNPFSGGAKYKVVGKNCDFRLKSPFISETVRDRIIGPWLLTCYGTLIESHRRRIDSFGSDDLSDL